MKKKSVVIIALVLCMALIFTGCGNASKGNEGGASAPAEKIVIQLNSSQPEGSLAVNGANRMKELVEQELGTDRVELQVFPSGQLGSDKAIIEGMSIGTHDALVVGATITNMDPKFYLFDLPYLFTTRDELEKVVNGEIGKKLNASLEEKGYVNLGYWFSGWRHISNSVRPIVTPEDLKGLKIRVTTSPSRTKVFTQLGATPTPLSAGEVFSALQQGVVDGQENPTYVMTVNSYKDVQKYFSKTGHLVLAYEVVFSKEKWDSYPADVQQALSKAAQTVADESWAMSDEIEKAAYEEIEKTMEINEVDMEAFKKQAEPLYADPYFVDAIGEELLNETLTTLGRK